MRVLLLLQAIAFWPVWLWYFRNAAADPEGAWGLVGLIGAAWMVWRHGRSAGRPIGTMDGSVDGSMDGRVAGGAAGRSAGYSLASAPGWMPVAMTMLYAAAYPFLSPLPRALLALSALGASLPALGLDRRAAVQAAGFLFLSMPVSASLQFYLGYPLRVFCGEAAARLLHLSGYPVLRDGMLLRWQEHAVLIDAPCSGIKMLWAGLLLGLALAAARDMGLKGTAGMLGAAFGAVLLGNILRTTALWFLETGLLPGPAWAHGALGALSFAAAAAGLVAVGRTRWMLDQGRARTCAA